MELGLNLGLGLESALRLAQQTLESRPAGSMSEGNMQVRNCALKRSLERQTCSGEVAASYTCEYRSSDSWELRPCGSTMVGCQPLLTTFYEAFVPLQHDGSHAWFLVCSWQQ